MPLTASRRDTTPLGPVMRPGSTRMSRRAHRTKAAADAVMLAGMGAAGLAAAPLLPQYGTVVPAAGAALVGSGLVAAVAGARRADRQEVLARLAEALASRIGGAHAAKIRASAWTGGWVGTPGRLHLTYDGAVDGTDPLFAPSVLAACSARLQRDYEIVRHDPRRCVLVLRARPVIDEREPLPEMALRTTKINTQLFGQDASIDLGWDEQTLSRISVGYQTHVRFTSQARRLAIQGSVNAMLPGRWSAHWDLEADTVEFHLRPTIPTTVPHPVLALEGEWVKRIPLGVDEQGIPVAWSLEKASGTPHFLCNGATGTGKTVIIRGIVIEAARRAWRVRVCDPKRIEFVGMRDWPNVEVVATAVEDIVAVIADTVREMERRYKLMEAGYGAGDFDRIVLVIDEVRYFYLIANAWWQTVRPKKSPSKLPLFDDLLKLLILARSCGINIVLGTQRPDAEWLGGEARDQLSARCSLGRLSPQGAQMMWGAQHIGVAVPRGVAGRGTAVNGAGDPMEFQGYWTPDPLDDLSSDDAAMLAALRPNAVTHPRLVVIRPELQTDDDGNPITEGTYEDYLHAPLEPLADHPELANRPDLIVLDRDDLPDADTLLADMPAWEREAADTYVDLTEEDLYGDPDERPVSSVNPGDLVCLDEAADQWVVVETAETDLVDDDFVALCYRLDREDGEPGVISLDASDRLLVRSPNNEPG